MEFYHYFPSVTFVLLTASHFVGRNDGLPKQDHQVHQRNCTFPLILGENQSPLYKDDEG